MKKMIQIIMVILMLLFCLYTGIQQKEELISINVTEYMK